MKNLFLALAVLVLSTPGGAAQDMEKQAPQGFDQVRTGIATSKLDSISYKSKTVGTTRDYLQSQ